MFLKQATVFHCPKNELKDLEFLVEAISDKELKSIAGTSELRARGFCAPVDTFDELALKRQGITRFAIREESKIIPAQIVNEELMNKVRDIQESQSRAVSRKEKKDIKEQVLFELSQQAFTRKSVLDLYYDEARQFLYVGTANMGKAEDAVSFLRSATQGLEAYPIETEKDPVSIFTQWIIDGEADEGFEFGDGCVMKNLDSESTGTIRVSNYELSSSDVQEHINFNNVVKEISLVHDERTSFAVTENLSLKRIKFMDIFEEKDISSDPMEFALTTQELMIKGLGFLYEDLIESMGGLRK